MRWRRNRVALYPISFEYDLSGANGFGTLLKRSLFFSEHVVVNLPRFSYFKISQFQTEFPLIELTY